MLPDVVVQFMVDELLSCWIFNASYSTVAFNITVGATYVN